MPAMHDEFELTNRQAGQILERLGSSGISYEQLKGVSATLSYLFSLKTGKDKENYSDVKVAMEGFLPKDFHGVKNIVPTRIPSPEQLKAALTKSWDAACGMSFARWITGLIALWCWCLWGCRSNCDLDSLKKSEHHIVNERDGWSATSYITGRNKLPGKKAGTRPWSCYFVCMCPNGLHQPVPNGWEWCIADDGNPSRSGPIPFCSECPINCIVLKLRRAGIRPCTCSPNGRRPLRPGLPTTGIFLTSLWNS